jgi:hypothetical protein
MNFAEVNFAESSANRDTGPAFGLSIAESYGTASSFIMPPHVENSLQDLKTHLGEEFTRQRFVMLVLFGQARGQARGGWAYELIGQGRFGWDKT